MTRHTANDRPVVTPRVGRVLALVATGVLLLFAAYELWVGFAINNWVAALDGDRAMYASAAQRWLAGGGFYLAHQLSGPYVAAVGDVLYPPTILYLSVGALVASPLWYLIPAAALAFVILNWRPALWTWPLMATCLAYPESLALLRSGNPDLWIMAAIAGGLQWGWPGAFVLLKPSLLPFALAGIRARGWWLAFALLVLLTVPLLSMVPDWLHVVFDARGPLSGVLYSLDDVPLVSIPLVAWLGRQRCAD